MHSGGKSNAHWTGEFQFNCDHVNYTALLSQLDNHTNYYNESSHYYL